VNTVLVLLSLISLGSVAGPPAGTPTGLRAKAAAAERVWSNDDIPYLRQNAPISTVGSIAPARLAPGVVQRGQAQLPYVKEHDPAWYQDQIDQRRAQIADIEAELAHIAFVEQGGQGISGAFPLTGSNPGILLPGTIYVLQQRDLELRDEIAELQDLGRVNRIPRFAWR
jgi:hypothetical protein